MIVFADRQPAGKLLEAAKRKRVKDEFIWVGSDAWASRESVVANREEFVEGAIAIQPLRRTLPRFNHYFQQLLTKPNPRNPWFNEYLSEYHNCSMDQSNYSRAECKPDDPSTHAAVFKYSQQQYIHFVRDAVYAFARAIHNLHVDSCKNFLDDRLCDTFKQRVFVDFVEYLRKVTFPDVDGNEFKFSGPYKHDGPPRYSIVSFQKKNGAYDWQDVGTFYNGTIKCKDQAFCNQFEEDPFKGLIKGVAKNVFSKSNRVRLHHKLKKCRREECSISEIKVPETNDKCCWHCKQCAVDEYKASEFECKPCQEGMWSGGPGNGGRSTCVEKPESYLDYSDGYAIGIIMKKLALQI